MCWFCVLGKGAQSHNAIMWGNIEWSEAVSRSGPDSVPAEMWIWAVQWRSQMKVVIGIYKNTVATKNSVNRTAPSPMRKLIYSPVFRTLSNISHTLNAMCVFVCTKQFIILWISLEAIWHPAKVKLLGLRFKLPHWETSMTSGARHLQLLRCFISVKRN